MYTNKLLYIIKNFGSKKVATLAKQHGKDCRGDYNGQPSAKIHTKIEMADQLIDLRN